MFVLTACEPEVHGPPPSALPSEAMCFDTEAVRREVDFYKDGPTSAARQRMERAFATLDSRIKGMEVLAQTQTGVDREAADRRIADLKRRRELHWTRAQTLIADTTPIRRAVPVGERPSIGGADADLARAARRASRARAAAVRRAAPIRPAQGNFFQRLFQ